MILLILVGFTLSLIIFVSLFYNPTQFNTDDFQDDIIPQHYNLEFIDHVDYLICHMKIFFQLTQNRYQFSIIKSIDHTIEISSIILHHKEISIPIDIQIKTNQIILEKKNVNGKKSTFNINIISSDYIISNLPLNQISSLYETSQVAFALLHQYECRSIDIVQLCFPINSSYDIDLFSHIFNYTLNTIQIFESYFSRRFPLNKLTLITILELNNQIISKPGLVFIDQNVLLINTSGEQIIQQRELIFLIVAYQWIDLLIQFDKDTKWFGQSLARSIVSHLFHKTYDTIGNNNSQIERFMSTVVLDSLCNDKLIEESNDVKSENILIEKGEAFLTEYRLYIGDIQFYSRIQQLIQHSNDSFLNQSILSSVFFTNSSSFLVCSKRSGHPIVFYNSSTIDMYLFKFNPNCSLTISSIHPMVYHLLNDSSSSLINSFDIFSNSSSILISLNPFIHIFYPSWNHVIDEIKIFRHQQLNTFSKLLFDSFLFNLANKISIKYSLQLINLFFQQSLTKSDLLIISKIVKWYRSMLSKLLEEKFLIFLRKILNPFCLNQLWTRQILIDIKYSNQQIINDILLELCCSINHSICLQQISNRNDPQILIQFIVNNQRFGLDLPSTNSIIYQNQTDMLTSFNQLQMPSLFIYPDRIIMNIICQVVRQQNDKYWYDLIHFIQQKFQYQLIPSAIITGLSCAIQTMEQIEFYLNNLCPPSPFKWPCYRNILAYSSIKNFEQLKTIDNEQWPTNNDELIDFLFHTSSIQGNFSSHPMILEFQSLIFTWLTTNQYEILHWLDNENNQNAYLI
ncbi:unnamed protein product [Rotaria sp. Silwood2]|nr:unnamed protein product [Rotaria sp. Silwood2]